MRGGSLPASVKRTSALRRLPPFDKEPRYRAIRGREGDVCAVELPRDAAPVPLEAPSGRAMTVAPGDRFLATPGCRESTRWISGVIPPGGLVPGEFYCVLADCGIVGEMVGDAPAGQSQPARVRYLGVVDGKPGGALNLRQFAIMQSVASDRNAPLYLVLGTSGDVGKTTAAIAVLRALRLQGHAKVAAVKATGTALVEEIAKFTDFGAAEVFDCVDFGLATTYPSGRADIADIFGGALQFCFALAVDALVVECGGDLFGACVPEFLTALRARRANFTIVLAAPDALGALGAKHALGEMGLAVSLITGPCTDTPSMRERTTALCGVPAVNLMHGGSDWLAAGVR